MTRDDHQEDQQTQRATTMDKHVGQRIRERRILLGLSQQQLASIIGVTYQQAHKYERGLNRISAGRLFTVAQALDIEPGWFFEGMAGEVEAEPSSPRQHLHLQLMRNFMLIKDEKHQEAISAMARTLATS